MTFVNVPEILVSYFGGNPITAGSFFGAFVQPSSAITDEFVRSNAPYPHDLWTLPAPSDSCVKLFGEAAKKACPNDISGFIKSICLAAGDVIETKIGECAIETQEGIVHIYKDGVLAEYSFLSQFVKPGEAITVWRRKGEEILHERFSKYTVRVARHDGDMKKRILIGNREGDFRNSANIPMRAFRSDLREIMMVKSEEQLVGYRVQIGCKDGIESVFIPLEAYTGLRLAGITKSEDKWNTEVDSLYCALYAIFGARFSGNNQIKMLIENRLWKPSELTDLVERFGGVKWGYLLLRSILSGKIKVEREINGRTFVFHPDDLSLLLEEVYGGLNAGEKIDGKDSIELTPDGLRKIIQLAVMVRKGPESQDKFAVKTLGRVFRNVYDNGELPAVEEASANEAGRRLLKMLSCGSDIVLGVDKRTLNCHERMILSKALEGAGFAKDLFIIDTDSGRIIFEWPERKREDPPTSTPPAGGGNILPFRRKGGGAPPTGRNSSNRIAA